MSEVVLKDHSIHEPSTAHIHPLETIPQGSQADGVEEGHEHHDVDPRVLKISLYWLAGLIAVSYALMFVVTHAMLNAAQTSDGLPSATYAERDNLQRAWPVKPIEGQLQPADEMPTLLADPEKPLIMLRDEEDAKLEGYNWRKDNQGRTTGVTVPIDKAIDMTLQRGLPTDNKARAQIEPPTGDVAEMGEIPNSEKVMMQRLKSERNPKNKNAGKPPAMGASSPH